MSLTIMGSVISFWLQLLRHISSGTHHGHSSMFKWYDYAISKSYRVIIPGISLNVLIVHNAAGVRQRKYQAEMPRRWIIKAGNVIVSAGEECGRSSRRELRGDDFRPRIFRAPSILSEKRRPAWRQHPLFKSHVAETSPRVKRIRSALLNGELWRFVRGWNEKEASHYSRWDILRREVFVPHSRKSGPRYRKIDAASSVASQKSDLVKLHA